VTAGGVRYVLEEPSLCCTQNPIEMEGTYPLPEAQLDRFMFNVVIDYLPEQDEVEVVKRTTSTRPEAIQPRILVKNVLRFQEVVRKCRLRRTLFATRFGGGGTRRVAAGARLHQSWVSWGAVCGRRSIWCWGPRRGRFLPDARMFPLTIFGPSFHDRLPPFASFDYYRAEAEGVNVENNHQSAD